MSKNADRDSAASDGREQEDPKELLARLSTLADKAAVRCRVPDYRDDLAQSAFAELWRHRQRTAERVSDSAASGIVMRFAREESNRRWHRGESHLGSDVAELSHESVRLSSPQESAEQDIGTPLRPAARNIPTLCPVLRCLGASTPQARSIDKHALAACATIARERRILDDIQYRMFDLAYVHARPAASIASEFRLSVGATKERLRRISNLLESELLLRIESKLPTERWALVGLPALHVLLTKNFEKVLTPLSPMGCGVLVWALRLVIHRRTCGWSA